MAIVRDVSIGSVEQEPLPGRAFPRFDDNASPADFGAGLGEGIASAAGQIGNVQDLAQARAQRQANQVRIAQANTQLSDYITDQSYTADNAAFRQRGPDAIAMDQRYLPGLDSQADAIRATLTPTQQAAFDVHASQMRNEWNLQLHRYEFEEGNRFAQQTFTDGIDKTISSSALNWRGMAADPTAYNLAKGQVSNMSEAMADRLRVGKKETSDANTDRLISATVESGLADGGTQQMSDFLEAHKGELTNPSAYPVLKDKVDAAMTKLQQQQLDGLSDKYQDAYRGALAGVPGSTGLISHDEVLALYKHDGEQRWQLLQKAAQAGATEKRFDQMSPADIQSELQQGDPTNQGAHLGQAQDLELYRFQQEAAQRSIARRSADGRQFLINTMDDPPIDWNQGDRAVQILDARANTAADDQRRLGVPVPLLSRPEAQQLNQSLQSVAPADQLQALTKLRDGLSTEQRFRSVIEQIRPDDPVMAEAALRVPQDPSKAPVWYNARFDNDINVSRQILEGNELLQPKGALAADEGKGGFKAGVAMPSDTTLRQAFDSRFPQGLFRTNPIEADHVYAAFRSPYASNVARLGDTSGEPNATALKATAAALMPKMDGHFAGPDVPVPTGMDPSRFPSFVRNAAAAAFTAHDLDPTLYRGYGLTPQGRVGSGRYVIMQDAHNQALDPKTGVPITIDLGYQYRRDTTPIPPRPTIRSAPADDDAADEPSRNPADYLPAIERPRG